MEIEYKPSVLKCLTVPVTLLVIALYLSTELWFIAKYGVSFAVAMSEQNKIGELFWHLAKIWLAHLLIVPFVFSLRHKVTDQSIIGYNDWLRKKTIHFSEIEKIKAGLLGLSIKIYGKDGENISIFRPTISGPEYSDVREKLGLE